MSADSAPMFVTLVVKVQLPSGAQLGEPDLRGSVASVFAELDRACELRIAELGWGAFTTMTEQVIEIRGTVLLTRTLARA